jgi:hypothetical protein
MNEPRGILYARYFVGHLWSLLFQLNINVTKFAVTDLLSILKTAGKGEAYDKNNG